MKLAAAGAAAGLAPGWRKLSPSEYRCTLARERPSLLERKHSLLLGLRLVRARVGFTERDDGSSSRSLYFALCRLIEFRRILSVSLSLKPNYA